MQLLMAQFETSAILEKPVYCFICDKQPMQWLILPLGGKYALDCALWGQSTVRGPYRVSCSLISSEDKEDDKFEHTIMPRTATCSYLSVAPRP